MGRLLSDGRVGRWVKRSEVVYEYSKMALSLDKIC